MKNSPWRNFHMHHFTTTSYFIITNIIIIHTCAILHVQISSQLCKLMNIWMNDYHSYLIFKRVLLNINDVLSTITDFTKWEGLTRHSSSRRSMMPSFPSMRSMHGWLSRKSMNDQVICSRMYSSCSSLNTCYSRYIIQPHQYTHNKQPVNNASALWL